MFKSGGGEAVELYLSVFRDSKLQSRFPEAPAELVMANFQLNGTDFMLINGGPPCEPTMATSFMVHCDSQEEVDHYWDGLGKGGSYQQCGWLTDPFGISWQIVPRAFGRMMGEAKPEQAQRLMAAMFTMTKFDIAQLETVFAGN